jgi:hypothetical protein
MLIPLPRRLALLIALAVPVAAPPVAGAATLQVDFPSPDVVEAKPTPMHVVASADPYLILTRIVAKPLTPEADCSRGPRFDPSPSLFDSNADIADLTTAVVFDRAGRWLVCGWAGGGPFEATWAEQIVQVVVRPPHARVAVEAPARARAGRSVRVSFDFDVEVPRRLLYAAVRGGHCGRGADAARAQRSRVLALPDPIAATGRGAATVRLPSPGRWRVCAYVQRDRGPGEANAVAGADVTVRPARTGRRGGPELGR